MEEQIAMFLAERTEICNATTLKLYGAILRHYDRWSAERPEPYSPASIRAYLASGRGLAGDTQRNRGRYLKLFCAWLVERGVLAQSPFDGPNRVRVPPRKRARRKVYTEADVVKLLQATAPRQWKRGERRTTRQQWRPDGPMRREALQGRALVLLLVDSALRASEVCALTCGQVRADKLRVRSKGGHIDVAFVSEATRAVLLELAGDRPDDAPLFRNWKGGRCTPASLRAILRRVAHRAGVELPPRPLHAFRHHAARQWLKAKLPDLVIRQLMRHDDIRTTQIYTELDDDELAALHAEASPIAGLMERAGLWAA